MQGYSRVLMLKSALLCLQVQVRVRDGGSPSKQSVETATLTVNVNRNKFAPEFEEAVLEVTIRSDARLDSTVDTIQATDADPGVSRMLVDCFLGHAFNPILT